MRDILGVRRPDDNSIVLSYVRQAREDVLWEYVHVRRGNRLDEIQAFGQGVDRGYSDARRWVVN